MALGNYEGISIREAMEKINSKDNGWYLPKTQRQYVWGARDSSEEYICLLLDSLLKGYPIGGLVIWETDKEVPFREFLGDYCSGAVAKIVPQGRWGAHKKLVYDGQQRLQTLYSVLYHHFNGRVLFYNLLFNGKNDIEETGFFFRNVSENPAPYDLSMSELSSKNADDITAKRQLRNRFTSSSSLDEETKALIEVNLDKLWSVFVETNIKSLAYFPVHSDNSDEVDEVFRRLNTGGMQLTQLELVLTKVKAKSTYFEEELWGITKLIKEATNGFEFTAFEIMQLIYLLVFKTTRVDEARVDNNNVNKLISTIEKVKIVLPNFFKYFFFEEFHINAKWLILRQQAILPMLVYCITLYENGYKWELYKTGRLSKLKTYFIKSQLCDWNTQTMVTQFSRIAADAAEKDEDFPLESITKIAKEKNRTVDVSYYQLEGPKWFSLKILMPGRVYMFNERTPQIDHIFPKDLKHGTTESEAFSEKVDVLWNMQPTPAGINRQKWDTHPVKYFSSEEGRNFIHYYDFLPKDLESSEWKNEDSFISFRKEKMIAFLKDKYDVDVVNNDPNLSNTINE